jgi:hypothetical protein
MCLFTYGGKGVTIFQEVKASEYAICIIEDTETEIDNFSPYLPAFSRSHS